MYFVREFHFVPDTIFHFFGVMKVSSHMVSSVRWFVSDNVLFSGLVWHSLPLCYLFWPSCHYWALQSCRNICFHVCIKVSCTQIVGGTNRMTATSTKPGEATYPWPLARLECTVGSSLQSYITSQFLLQKQNWEQNHYYTNLVEKKAEFVEVSQIWEH